MISWFYYPDETALNVCLPFTSKVSHREGSSFVRENLKAVAEVIRRMVINDSVWLGVVILSNIMWV